MIVSPFSMLEQRHLFTLERFKSKAVPSACDMISCSQLALGVSYDQHHSLSKSVQNCEYLLLLLASSMTTRTLFPVVLTAQVTVWSDKNSREKDHRMTAARGMVAL